MFSKVKQHISSNRGKYGTAVGAGAAYGASQIPTVVDNVPILANQAIYNGMVKGNNLLQSGKEAIGMNAGPKVNQDEIDMVNDYYNSPLAKVYNPTPGQMIQAGNSTNEFINDTKDNYNNATGYIVDKYNQAKDYIGESTVSTHTINIKQALLEGYTAQEITEAVHANHPHLDKRKLERTASERINLANDISNYRRNRDEYRNNKGKIGEIETNVTVDPNTSPTYKQLSQRKANQFDNRARSVSQTGGFFKRSPLIDFMGDVVVNRPKEDKTTIGKLFNLPNYISDTESINKIRTKPRIISSAKK